MSTLFCFGLGYTARTLARMLAADGWRVGGTSRSADGVARLAAEGLAAQLFDGASASPALTEAARGASHILVSIPPGPSGDPTLTACETALAAGTASGATRWIGYLSTVGVYGDHGGAWVDEETEPRPATARAARRLEAERAWQTFAERHGAPVHIFRLPGIYGPGRNTLVKLRAGRARRISKPGQVFNRAHVHDIARALRASMAAPRPGAIYNIADDEPAPPEDVVAYAARLLGMEPPPLIPFEEAQLSDMARSFWGESKRVSNRRMHDELGLALAFPTYREGLRALLADMAEAEAGGGSGSGAPRREEAAR